jgi:hypothetical protein
MLVVSNGLAGGVGNRCQMSESQGTMLNGGYEQSTNANARGTKQMMRVWFYRYCYSRIQSAPNIVHPNATSNAFVFFMNLSD